MNVVMKVLYLCCLFMNVVHVSFYVWFDADFLLVIRNKTFQMMPVLVCVGVMLAWILFVVKLVCNM